MACTAWYGRRRCHSRFAWFTYTLKATELFIWEVPLHKVIGKCFCNLREKCILRKLHFINAPHPNNFMPKQCAIYRAIVTYHFELARCFESLDICEKHTYIHTYIDTYMTRARFPFHSGFAPSTLSLRLNKWIFVFVFVFHFLGHIHNRCGYSMPSVTC